MTEQYRYSNNWFTETRYGKHMTLKKESTQQVFERLLLPEAKRGGCRRILELGLSEGRSSIWMLENLKPEIWVGIDAWSWGRAKDKPLCKQQEENFWHNMAAASRWAVPKNSGAWRWCGSGDTICRVLKGYSQDLLMQIDGDYPGQPFDFCYLDGDHTGPGTILDAVLCWRKLAIGGLMIFDDYDRRWHNARPCTHEAVNAFWMTHEHFCEKVFENRFQFWLRKKAQ